MIRAFAQGEWVCAQFRVQSFTVCQVFGFEDDKIVEYYDYISRSRLT